jgi:hypothetical protein
MQGMKKQEINPGCTDAPTGVTPRLTDDTAVIGGGPAELSEGEERRITLLLSWKPTPADFLTVGGNEIQDAVPEEAGGV